MLNLAADKDNMIDIWDHTGGKFTEKQCFQFAIHIFLRTQFITDMMSTILKDKPSVILK